MIRKISWVAALLAAVVALGTGAQAQEAERGKGTDPKKQAEAVFGALKEMNWEKMYHLLEFSAAVKKDLPKDPKKFAEGVQQGFDASGAGGQEKELFASIAQVKIGEPKTKGKKATLPTSCQLTVQGQTVTFKGVANMIKVGNVWKLDLTSSDDPEKATAEGLGALLGKPAGAE